MKENIKELVAKYEIAEHMVTYLEVKYEEIIENFGSIEDYIKELKGEGI